MTDSTEQARTGQDAPIAADIGKGRVSGPDPKTGRRFARGAAA